MITFDDTHLRRGDFYLCADFQIAPGLTAVLGPSGAGKSSLLEALAGFLPLASGRILWDGRPLPQTPQTRPVAMVFQDHNLFAHLTVEQNIALGLRPDLRIRPADRAQIAQVLARLGLDGMAARYPRDISGGQQSRVALARALVSNRPIVALDEAFAALGPALRSDLVRLVHQEFSDRHVVMVTHDAADAALADHLILVAQGVAHPPCPAQHALADPGPELRAYLGR